MLCCSEMFASYHNHTDWSDGNTSIHEMIDAARKAGIREFGISDHFLLDPQGGKPYSAIAQKDLGRYIDAVQTARESFVDMDIRLGLEVDYFPETFEETAKILELHSFDYLIGSVHTVKGFQIDGASKSWFRLSPEDRDEVWHCYWQRIKEAAETGFFDIIGHFDLPKKYGYYPSSDLTEEVLNALDAIFSSDTAIEINTAGWDKPVREAYPSMKYLREARQRNIPLVISADAHETRHVDRHFNKACLWARRAGYFETACFSFRTRTSRTL